MLFNHRTFFVKERVALLKLTDVYDILDPQTDQPIGIARDEPATWAKYLRLLVKKHMLPTTIRVYENEMSPAVLTLRKGPGFLRTTVTVTNVSGAPVGRFRSKLFSLGGGFFVYGANDQQVAEVKGDWKGWNFRFLDANGAELGVVTKKWAGLGAELLTTADRYVISLSNAAAATRQTTELLLAAGLAIDIVFKEQG